MKTRGERLRFLRERAGFTSARDAAQKFGVAVSTYNAHERAGQPGGRDFDEVAATRYARWFRGSMLWLFHGRGEPDDAGERAPLQQQFERGLEPDIPPDPDHADGNHRRERKRLAPGELPEVDVRAGMGGGGITTEIVVDGMIRDNVVATWRMPVDYLHTELRAREANVDIIPVVGDSMEPTLLHGDRVLIDHSHMTPAPDGLYAIGSPFGVMVKRLQYVQGSRDPVRLRIISDNPRHAPEELTVEEVHVIGRVIARISRL